MGEKNTNINNDNNRQFNNSNTNGSDISAPLIFGIVAFVLMYVVSKILGT